MVSGIQGVCRQSGAVGRKGGGISDIIETIIKILDRYGYVYAQGLAGMPTCFTGTFRYGTGKPVMGILGEYDALSGLNQTAALPVKKELSPGAPGHGCGHSALGAGSLGAALAVKDYLEICKKDGTIIYFGCPAEEGEGGGQRCGHNGRNRYGI